jgi:hypothetical protein
MCPLAQSDGHDAPRLVDEFVPCFAAMIDEILVRLEDSVGQPVVAHELPDVFDRVELGAFWRQGDNGDVGRYDEARGHVPAGLIDEENGMGSGCDRLGDFSQVQVHRLGVASGQDQGRTLAMLRADGTEDVGGGGALVTGGAGAGAAFRPAAGDLVLLADTSLIGEPYFYRVPVDRLFTRDCVQAGGETFLKFSIEPSA